MVKEMTYEEAGVDLKLGDDVSKILYNAAKTTWENRKGDLGEVIVPVDDFSGIRAVNVGGLPKGTLMNLTFDGIGTKVEVGQRAKKIDKLAFDLFAMVCDDCVRWGAEPVLVGSILDVRTLKAQDKKPFLNEVRQLAKGYVEAAQAANVAVVNGETAELGYLVGGYGEFNFNWGAGAAWFGNKERALTGKKVEEGDVLVGLREKGFRSNGFTLARKVLEKTFGQDWHTARPDLADYLIEPSTIYSATIVDMTGGWNLDREPKADVRGVAHISGGGIPGKLGRMLKPTGLGAVIDDPIEPNEMMGIFVSSGYVAEAEACRSWNMGQGMIVASPAPEHVMDVAKAHGIHAQEIGYVTAKGYTEIVRRFSEGPTYMKFNLDGEVMEA